MKLQWILSILPMCICLIFAGCIIMLRGGEAAGWGWLLFVALLLAPSWGETTKVDVKLKGKEDEG